MTQLFNMLDDDTRLKIVMALRVDELCVHEIASAVQMSVSAVSHQLRLLRTMKLVKHRKQGKMVYYMLDDQHIEILLNTALQHAQEKR